MQKRLQRLIELDREQRLLAHVKEVLGWDQETYMPPRAVDERSEQIALIAGLAHDKAAAPEIGELLAALGSSSESPLGDPSLPEIERAYLRVLRRTYDRQVKLPVDLVEELAKAASLGQAAWFEAKTRSDFALFAPRLERLVMLLRRKAACLGPGKPAYDVLLDEYEPGSTSASVAAIFAALRGELVSLLRKIEARPQVEDSILKRPCPSERQAAISGWLMDVLAFDRTRGRLDTTEHPFTTTLGRDDVRITTHYLPDFLPSSVFSTIHETGHALYELDIAPGPEFVGTSLADPASMAIHESQSRMLENVIGRSRAFWKPNYSRLVRLAGGALDGVGLDAFAAAINKVEPSLIRTEADEVTYGLHVILRFELEAALLSGDLAVRDLPAAWNEKMRDLVGLAPPDDARGCLQDVHWSLGLFGYFPSYALGNLYAAQFWSAMNEELPGVEGEIEAGDLAGALGWLKEKVHRPGAIYLPGELVEKVTGHALDPSHFAAYLEGKYSKVYGF